MTTNWKRFRGLKAEGLWKSKKSWLKNGLTKDDVEHDNCTIAGCSSLIRASTIEATCLGITRMALAADYRGRRALWNYIKHDSQMKVMVFSLRGFFWSHHCASLMFARRFILIKAFLIVPSRFNCDWIVFGLFSIVACDSIVGAGGTVCIYTVKVGAKWRYIGWSSSASQLVSRNVRIRNKTGIIVSLIETTIFLYLVLEYKICLLCLFQANENDRCSWRYSMFRGFLVSETL